MAVILVKGFMKNGLSSAANNIYYWESFSRDIKFYLNNVLAESKR